MVAAPPPVLDGLIKSGKVAAESKIGLVRSANGIAVRKGAPKPDISSLDSFKRALLDAKSITYLPAPGVPQIIERLGLKDTLAAKTTIPKTDLSSELVAKGDAGIGYCAYHSGLHHSGRRTCRTSAVRNSVLYGLRWCNQANSKSHNAASDLLKFLKGSSAPLVIKEQGMEPI